MTKGNKEDAYALHAVNPGVSFYFLHFLSLEVIEQISEVDQNPFDGYLVPVYPKAIQEKGD